MLLKVSVIICLALSSISGNYFNSPEYLKLTAKEKHEKLEKAINQDKTPQGYFSSLTTAGLLVQDNSVTMTWKGDVLPEGRNKLIHSEGVVAPCIVNFKSDSGYSGLLSEKLDFSFIRLSVASNLKLTNHKPSGAQNNFTPGLGLKILIDKEISQNIVAMYDIANQDSWDFFEHKFTNMFDINAGTPLAKVFVARAFKSVTNWISSVGIREWAEVKQDGTKVNREKVKYPFQLYFVPTEEVTGLYSKNYTKDYITILSTIKPGTKIYYIEAIEKPGCKPVRIGDITLTESPTTSEFGDRKLFFRHGLIDNDDKFPGHEGFDQFRDSYGFFGRYEKKNPSGAFKCPLANIISLNSRDDL